MFLWIRRLVTGLGFLGLLLVLVSQFGCAECRHDADCETGALCKNGACQVDTTPPPPRRGECISGEQRGCYNGPEGTANKGLCKQGFQVCNNGSWNPCQEEVKPAKEDCDGKDNDCDGTVDNGCDCKDGDTQTCYTGTASSQNKGLCKDGVQTCADGIWGTCLNQILPQAEVCDNKDNDCNGLVDDGVSKKCQNKCGVGEEICKAGAYEACNAPQPTKETCGDNKDNDCDGTVDEDCECTPNTVRKCYSGAKGTEGQGPCKGGAQSCSADGKWLDCTGQVLPTVEQCNNRDDDCNGSIDDNLKRPCSRGCNSGQEYCQAGQWKGCNAVPADPEICDGKDNDCNGKKDDLPNGKKCECNVGDTETCYSGPTGTLGQGPCRSGKRTCQSTGKWSICLNQIVPSVETCNGKDDDCDGRVDNTKGGNKSLTKSCYGGTPGTAGKGACKAGVQTCQGGFWSNCTGEVRPKTETCNNKDDNCDGKTDNGLTQTCYSGSAGTAEVCQAGQWKNCNAPKPQTEVCNNKDDDCNGSIDDGINCTILATGDWAGKVQIWNPFSLQKIRTHTTTTSVYSVTYSPNKQILAVGSVGKVQLWSATSSTSMGSFTTSKNVRGLTFSPDSTKIAAGNDNNQVVIWQVSNGSKLRTISTTARVRSLAWHPNGSLLAGAVSGTVIFWNASTGSTSNTISTGFTVYSIAINKAGTSMLVAGSGGSSPKMELWDISSTPYKRTISFSPTSCAVVVYHTSFSPDSTMATAACPGAAYVWKVSTQQQVAKVTKSGYYFYTAGLTPDNKTLAVGGRQSGSAGHLYLYNITGPTPSQIFVDTTTHSNYLWSLSFRP